MSQSSGQSSELPLKTLEAAVQLTELAMENSRRIVDLHLETARALLDDSLKSAKALAEATDPQAQFALRTQFVQDTARRVSDAARRMGEIGSEAQAEFTRTLGQQMTGAGSELMEAFQKMMAVSNIPGGAANPAAGVQQAFDATRKAFEEMTRVSTAAFANYTNPGKGK
ncbi:MAG TPA: phasin family protein [Burkholderiales bacterium]|nr:phasin family protein [Burkholderiales bacterium]